MSRILITGAMTAALLAGAPHLAWAQDGFHAASAGGSRHLLRVGFGGGASVPMKRAADVLKRGVNGQAFVLINLPGLPSIRLNLGYQKFDLKEALLAAATGTEPGQTPGQSQMISGVAGTSINLFQLGPIRPYITAGVGAFNLKDTFASDTGSTSVSSLKFGIDGGGGLAIRLGRLEAFVEGRVQNVYTSDKGLVDTKSIQSIPVSFGIIF
jgi:hypothetical protein